MASSQTATKKDDKPAESKPEQQPTAEQKPAALEEDDEFEDFPVDGASSRRANIPKISRVHADQDNLNRLGAGGHRGCQRRRRDTAPVGGIVG
jgi:hypothetical protein